MHLNKHRGLSLIELMIGLLVGTLVVAGATQIFTRSAGDNDKNLQLNTLNQDLRSMMEVMLLDLRRAGFAANNPDSNADGILDTAIKSNAFAQIEVSDDQSCIVYMINKNGNSPPTETNERLGFKMEPDNTANPPKSVLRIRRSSLGLSCDSGLWENFTAPEVEITGLSFTLNETPLNITALKNNPANPVAQNCAHDAACLYLRQINISLSGRLVDNHDIQQTISGSVKVRNNRFEAHAP